MVLVCTSAVALTVAALPTSASAAGWLGSGAVGTDISWPQCGKPLPPTDYQFGIIGVTGGRPFTGNPCMPSQLEWAKDGTGTPELYINLDYGVRSDGPLTCQGEDTGCQAYNYGYDSAQWAYGGAAGATSDLSSEVAVWWLDVELGNSWSDDPQQNSYVIQGALDFLGRVAGRVVGIYSTSYQWRSIAGSYAPPGVPNWVAGASSLNDWAQCSNPLWPGAQVWAFQYLNTDLDLDQNRSC